MFKILIFLAFFTSAALADTISGSATIGDGDTYRFADGTRVRLFGVDTPEKNQLCEHQSACYRCGQEATKFVREFVGDEPLSCSPTGAKTYGRIVATCSVAGRDLGQAILANGWGVAYRQYLKGSRLEQTYLAAEVEAKRARLGIFRGNFIDPGNWRNRKARLECERR